MRSSLVLVLSCLSVSSGLQCYSCNYNSSQADCERFSPEPAWEVTCPATSQSCLVTRGTFQQVSILTRECGGPANLQGCRTRQLGGEVTATICSCSTDLCNLVTGGGSVLANTITKIISVLYFISMSKM